MTAAIADGFYLLVLPSAFGLAHNKLIGAADPWHVDADGWLHEPFALIPLGWLSGLTGVSMVAAGMWRRRR